MSHSPLISVVMLTYNGERFLRQQLDSILAQDHSNIEIIASDDCSSDDTLAILESYKDEPRLKIFRNDHNLGFRRNFIQACKRASGDYIALADQDDIWLPHKLSTLLAAIGIHTLAYSNSQLMDENGTLLPMFLNEHHHITPVTGHCFRAFYFANCIAAHTILFRRDIVETLPAVPDNLYHDQWLGFICALQGSITYINKPLVHYRQHQRSVTGAAKDQKKLNLRQRIADKYQRQCHKLDNKIEYLEKMLAAQQQHGQTDLLLEALTMEYRRHGQHVINIKLLRLLWKNYGELFAILPHKNRTGVTIKEATGTRHYRLLKGD